MGRATKTIALVVNLKWNLMLPAYPGYNWLAEAVCNRIS
jgi:hypothetical protein